MILISLLLVLLLEHHMKVSYILKDRLSAHNWLPLWVETIEPKLHNQNVWFSLAVVLLLPVAIIYWLTSIDGDWLLSILQFGLTILVLIYSLGPMNQNAHLSAYFKAVKRDDLQAAYIEVQENLNQKSCLAPPKDIDDLGRTVTHLILKQCNFRLFGVLLYFVIFGIAGALAYNLICSHEFRLREDKASRYRVPMAKMRQIIDWLPQRLTGLLYALAGDFNGALSQYMKYFFKSPKKSIGILVDTGMGALGYSEEDRTEEILLENEQAMALVSRSASVFVLMIAILTVFGWLS